MSFAPVFRQTFRRPDVALLRTLVAAAQQDDDRTAPLLKLDAVAGTVMDAQFTDAVADKQNIASVSICQPVKPTEDRTSGPLVLQPAPPFAERLRLAQFNQGYL
jgi:hypothetical protein